MNKRRTLIIVFAFLSLLVITMALSGYPSGGVTSSQARGDGGSGIFSLLAETPLPDFLNAFLPLVMYSWPSPTPTPTATATLTPTPTFTPTPTQPSVEPFTQCSFPPGGTKIQYGIDAIDIMEITNSGKILTMEVLINISHTFVNDMVITLEQKNTSKKITLIDRPETVGGFICTGDDINVTLLDDESLIRADRSCISNAIPAISGVKRSFMLYVPYIGENLASDWWLTIRDEQSADDGWLNSWCLKFKYTEN